MIGLGTVLVAGCSSGGDDPSDAEAPPPTTVGPTTTAPAPTAPATTTPATTAPADDAGAVPLPDAVGMDLQAAQDAMQAAGFYLLTSHDATGQGRFQVLDRNWTVCDQTPAAGSPTDPDTVVDFGAVKDDETCPP